MEPAFFASATRYRARGDPDRGDLGGVPCAFAREPQSLGLTGQNVRPEGRGGRRRQREGVTAPVRGTPRLLPRGA
jgi:hypothetical protein